MTVAHWQHLARTSFTEKKNNAFGHQFPLWLGVLHSLAVTVTFISKLWFRVDGIQKAGRIALKILTGLQTFEMMDKVTMCRGVPGGCIEARKVVSGEQVRTCQNDQMWRPIGMESTKVAHHHSDNSYPMASWLREWVSRFEEKQWKPDILTILTSSDLGHVETDADGSTGCCDPGFTFTMWWCPCAPSFQWAPAPSGFHQRTSRAD